MNEPQINPQSRDWLLVEASVRARLAKHRTTLESVAIDEVATAVLRGRIAELKALLELGQPQREFRLTATDPLGQE